MSLEKILNPRSIAVVGASNNEKSVGYAVFKNLKEVSGVKVYPVNKKRKVVQGVKCFERVSDIKDELDLTIIAIPSNGVLEVVKDCCSVKVKGIVIMSSGFLESGKEGRSLAFEILDIARKNNVRILGPNCMGFINTEKKLNATFTSFFPKRGDIAFVSQSGALGSAFLDYALKNEIGISFFASIGSMIDAGFSDFLEYLERDENTKCIALYMESLTNADKFMDIAKRCSKKKPIFVLKSGRSARGAKAAMSHTGNLAGSDKVFDAFFKRAGLIRVDSYMELVDCLNFYSCGKLPQGNRVAIVTNAGGPGVLTTDAITNSKICSLSDISNETILKLNSFLPSSWSHSNPIDLLGDADDERYRKAIEVCIRDKDVDAVFVLLTCQSMTDPEKIAKSIVSIKSRKPILASFIGGRSVKEAKVILKKGGIASFDYPERMVKSFCYYCNFLNFKKKSDVSNKDFSFKPNISVARQIIDKAISEKRLELTEDESKRLLSSYGINVSKDIVCKSQKEVISACKKIGFPVVMKISSPDIVHKSDIGAVILNINSYEEAKKAYVKIIENSLKAYKNAKIYGVSVSKMHNKRHELIIGFKRDEIFGPCFVFGRGGVYVDLYNDLSFEVLPIDKSVALNMIKNTKVYDFLVGYRGIPGVNLDEIAFSIYKFSLLARDFPQIKEADINPYSVDEDGGIALDSKVILDENFFS